MSAPRTPATPWRAARPALKHFGVMTLADIMTEGGADAVGARQELMYRERAALLAALHATTDRLMGVVAYMPQDAQHLLEHNIEANRALLATLDPPTAE